MTFEDPAPIAPIDLTPFLPQIVADRRLKWHGIHGAAHWARVLENGLRLSERTGADAVVVALFAIFHDSRRVNDSWDPGHGRRGAELARSLRGQLASVSDDAVELLCYACEHHTAGRVDGDVTVQTCWDADRLDLGRVGIWPDPRKLCTPAARDRQLIAWALERSQQSVVPTFVTATWEPALDRR